MSKDTNKKTYVLDTNILIQSPNAVFGFADNNVVITATTLQELDGLKNAIGETGYKAREAIRILFRLSQNASQDNFKKKNKDDDVESENLDIEELGKHAKISDGNLLEGIKINQTSKGFGTFRIEPNGTAESLLPKGFSLDKPDNRIINSTLFLKLKEIFCDMSAEEIYKALGIAIELDANDNPILGEKDDSNAYIPKGISIVDANKHNLNKLLKREDVPVILITNDIAMRINAETCGLEVQGYKNEQLETDVYYSGRQDLVVSEKNMQKLYKIDNQKDKTFLLSDVLTKTAIAKLHFEPNEYVVFTDGNGGQVIGRCLSFDEELGYTFRLLNKNYSPMDIKARNNGQKMALDALLAPVEEIPLVFLKGKAGTAKTFLSLAAGLDQTLDEKFDKVMITRTNTLSDADMGFLPGSLEDKMGPLVAPFMDNLESLFKGYEGSTAEEARIHIEDLLTAQTVEICAVAYMRGRSITNSYLIVDEAQNSTIGQILEIVTRAGEGTKIVICGDPDQIDNPKLDRLNNGLVFASERMKGSPLCAQITFSKEETVRSKLASEAAVRLTLNKK